MLLALPVLVSAYPPMSDLPFHEASVSVLRHLRDRSMFPAGLYFVNAGQPNQLFHIAAFVLSLFVSTTAAVKIVVALAVLALPVAAARLCDHLGASRWAAVLVAPLAVGWLFFMGLVANLIGLALFLVLLPALDRFVDRPTPRGALGVTGAMLALYLGHESMLFIYAGALLLFSLAQTWSARAMFVRLVPFVVAVVVVLAQLAYQRTLADLTTPARGVTYLPPDAKLLGVPSVLLSAYELGSARIVFALLVVAVVAMATQRFRARPSAPRGTVQTMLRSYRFELVALCCFTAYLAFPAALNGATWVYHRFLPPAFALAAITASPRRTDGVAPRLNRLTLLLAPVAPIAMLLVVWPAFAESSRSFRDVETLLPQIAKGSAVALMTAPSATHGYVRGSLGARALTERGGRMLFSFSESPIAPVMVTKSMRWNDPVTRSATREKGFCPSWDLQRFRYVLLNAETAQGEWWFSRALSPEARPIASAGEWTLFESTLSLSPIDAPDVTAPPECATDTLGVRLEREKQFGEEIRERNAMNESGKTLGP